LGLTPGVVHVAYGDCDHCAYGSTYPGCGIACVSYIEDVIFRRYVAPEEVAAIFVEPILGEGGYIVPPLEFHRRLRELASKYGILFVADEVQSGMGRTGRMFAIEHWRVVPDVITIAKGVASGMPLGATVASSRIMSWKPGSHGSTFGGNPVSCAAALETIALLENGLVENAARMGEYIMHRLEPIADRFRHIGRISGKGLMIGIEILRNKRSRKPYPALRDRIVEACFWKGLLILPCGPSSVRFVPPLVIGEREADIALSIFEDVLSHLEGKRGTR